MNENKWLKNLAMVIGFIAMVASIAAAVYGVIKYFDRKQEEEFMDYYFDEDDDFNNCEDCNDCGEECDCNDECDCNEIKQESKENSEDAE